MKIDKTNNLKIDYIEYNSKFEMLELKEIFISNYMIKELTKIRKKKELNEKRIKTQEYVEKQKEHWRTIVKYKNDVKTYKEKNEYDKKFRNFSANGKLKIDGIIYDVDNFFIVYGKYMDKNKCYLINVEKEDELPSNKYNNFETKGIIKLKYTSTIYDLFLNSKNENNEIVISSEDLENVVNKWDGLVNKAIPETQAFSFEKIWEE